MLLEKQMLNQKKKDLFNIQMNDLNNFNNHKNQINELKKLDNINTKKLIDYENENFLNEYKIFQNRLKNMNKNIYRNVNDYNNYFKKINPNIFNCNNNDYEFNQKVAEEKLENERLNKFNLLGIDQRIDFINNLQNEDKNLKEKKLFNQKLYKNYLDNQNKMNKINMLKNNYDYKNNLLLPAYYYPNRPIPIYKKAKDSLLFSKNQSQILDNHNLKKFFEYDSQFNTLIDYENNNNNTYLGDSNLRHNPITCPVNDYNYNKYINLFKKRCEYIPNMNERSYSVPRVNRNFLSQNFNY